MEGCSKVCFEFSMSDSGLCCVGRKERCFLQFLLHLHQEILLKSESLKGCDGFVSVFIEAVFIVWIVLSVTLCMTSSSHVSLVSCDGGGSGSGGTGSGGIFSVCISHSSLSESLLLSSLSSLLSWMSCKE